MEIRKLQKVGSSTLSVSLPSAWAASQGLKRGASVQLVEDGVELRVIPLADGKVAITRDTPYLVLADECKSSDVLARVIIANYVLGRDHLVVRSKGRLDAELVDAVRRTSKKLIGVGIIEEGPNEITLQCSVETQRYPVDTLFKRLYNLSSSAITDAIEALRTRDARLAHVAASREEDADMIFWLIMRLILSAQQDENVRTLIGLKSRADIAGYSIIAADLERIADQAKVIATNAAGLIQSDLKIPGAIQNTLRELATDVGTLFSDAMRALLSRELEMGVEATEIAARLWKGEEDLALQATKLISEPEAMLRIRRILLGLVLVAGSCRQIAIVAFSRHQHEATKYSRPMDDRAPPRAGGS